MIWIILILLFIILVYYFSSITPKKLAQQIAEIDVPNPENSHPKRIINFINDHESSIIKQVHAQLIKRNKKIPLAFEVIFQDKIKNGFIHKEKYLWTISMEEYDIVQNEIKNLEKSYEFEIKGLQNYRYRKAIKNCIKYEEVFLAKEPYNKFDKSAIKIFSIEGDLGYVPSAETTEVGKIIIENHNAYLESIFENDNFIEAYVIIHHG